MRGGLMALHRDLQRVDLVGKFIRRNLQADNFAAGQFPYRRPYTRNRLALCIERPDEQLSVADGRAGVKQQDDLRLRRQQRRTAPPGLPFEVQAVRTVTRQEPRRRRQQRHFASIPAGTIRNARCLAAPRAIAGKFLDGLAASGTLADHRFRTQWGECPFVEAVDGRSHYVLSVTITRDSATIKRCHAYKAHESSRNPDLVSHILGQRNGREGKASRRAWRIRGS